MPVLRLPLLPAAAGKQHWGNLPGAALSLAIAEAASAAKRFTLLLTADSQSAERLEQELGFFAPDLPVLHFPDWETLPYDLFSPHQDIISQRIASLYRLPELSHGVLVVCRSRPPCIASHRPNSCSAAAWCWISARSSTSSKCVPGSKPRAIVMSIRCMSTANSPFAVR
ncbi:transcription-repair coupling factor (superfamily II helicase) [Pseudomonas sp. S30_BP2TU TE3576]